MNISISREHLPHSHSSFFPDKHNAPSAFLAIQSPNLQKKPFKQSLSVSHALGDVYLSASNRFASSFRRDLDSKKL